MSIPEFGVEITEKEVSVDKMVGSTLYFCPELNQFCTIVHREDTRLEFICSWNQPINQLYMTLDKTEDYTFKLAKILQK